MSTTRKILGAARTMLGRVEFYEQPHPLVNPGAFQPATLVIGGKCYTQEEHEAEFQRRVKAMLKDVRDKLASGWIHPDEITTIATSHGIQLP